MTDIDFSKTRKKKKTKIVIEDDIPMEEFQLDEGFSIPLNFEGKRKKRKNFHLIFEDEMYLDEDNKENIQIDDFNYDVMLAKFYAKVAESNPDFLSSSKRLIMVPPMMAKVGSKKTSFVNFPVICRTIDRDQGHVKTFLENELGTTSDVNITNQLLLRGRFQNAQIENLLKKYCRAYVLCKTCNSSSSKLEKEQRLMFLSCKACGSRYTVDQLSAGYQAVTGKRAAIRAKETK